MTKTFIHDDFILYNRTASELFHNHAKDLPIIDFHNHLNPQEIYEDKMYDNMTEVWLGGDHYKWRAMRANGISERLITGDSDPYEKFLAYAETIQNSFGNPLYHWTHLELKRYFDIEETLSPSSAHGIWDACNHKLRDPGWSARNLLRMQKAKILCTTDDPADTLEWHKKIRTEVQDLTVLPSFRPGGALDIEKSSFADYIGRLGRAADLQISCIEDLMEALSRRLAFFIENGCRVTDHSLESGFYRGIRTGEADRIFRERLAGNPVSKEEAAGYRGYILTLLGRLYADRGLVMQLHIGAIRNNSSRMFARLGADAGFDSLNDFEYAPQLSALLNAMDSTDQLPRTILYCLNPKDLPMLAAMAGNFQANEEGIRSRIQLGSAWWFCDHLHGMEEQLQALCDVGLLSSFIGMLTDSRSFLSYPRHEYFRRILCNKVGDLVEKGQYPADMDYLGKMIENICCGNAETYFRF